MTLLRQNNKVETKLVLASFITNLSDRIYVHYVFRKVKLQCKSIKLLTHPGLTACTHDQLFVQSHEKEKHMRNIQYYKCSNEVAVEFVETLL